MFSEKKIFWTPRTVLRATRQWLEEPQEEEPEPFFVHEQRPLPPPSADQVAVVVYNSFAFILQEVARPVIRIPSACKVSLLFNEILMKYFSFVLW